MEASVAVRAVRRFLAITTPITTWGSIVMETATALADIDTVLRATAQQAGRQRPDFVMQLATRLHACIARHAPPGSTYRQQADRAIALAPPGPGGQWFMNAGPDMHLVGVLQALRHDLAGGVTLARFEELVRADVLGDLLAQAEELATGGFSRAAAVLAGAALEEHLRKLAVKHSISLQVASGRRAGQPKAASELNTDLKAATVYDDLRRTVIEGWQKLRNKAAHGLPGFDGGDVTLVAEVPPMIDGVRRFIMDFPA